MTGRVAEFLISDAGGVTLSVRPPLPFLPDGVRLIRTGVEVFAGPLRLQLEADPEQREAILMVGGLLLVEHSTEAGTPPRELELMLAEPKAAL